MIMEQKTKIFLAIIGILLLTIISWIYGYWIGYTDDTLNLQNAISFCKSKHNGKMCSWNSEEITCAGQDNCFGYVEGNSFYTYSNPDLRLLTETGLEYS